MANEGRKFHIREIVEDDDTQTLLNSLTLDQLRSAIRRLSPNKNISLSSLNEAYEAIAKTGRSVSEIQTTLLDIECETPFKHCLFIKSVGSDLSSVLTENITDFEEKNFEYKFRHRRALGKYCSLTFEHHVDVIDWVTSDDSESKVKKRIKVRHPIVVRIDLESGVFALLYPGFTQGNATKRKDVLIYEDILSALLSKIGEKFNLNFLAIPIQQSIKYCINGDSSRVLLIRSEIEQSSGHIGLSSTNQKKDVEQLLASFIAPHFSKDGLSDLGKAINKAISEATANTIVLYWLKEEVFTRLRFWEIGTEILFIWHGTPSSYHTIDEIINLLILASENIPSVANSNWLEWIASLQPRTVIIPAQFSTQFDLNVKQARTNLINAMKIGLIKPVYRIRTNTLLEETINSWTDSLDSLKRIFHTSDSHEIDGADLNSIEVAYMRVDAGKASA